MSVQQVADPSGNDRWMKISSKLDSMLRSKTHQRKARVMSKDQPGRATPEDRVGFTSMGEDLSVRQRRKLTKEVDLA